ncbi:YfaP family protein [Aneurinibacillus aneurinilyticus]|uniref:YfaP family protein n=1 Tax=Aneurinibacillus aneurinilyticus TaxID=1391 RepID=UPI0035263CF5
MDNDNTVFSNNVKYDNSNDQYPQFSEVIKHHFSTFDNLPLFTTDAEGLFEVFLESLPHEARQHYTCSCCRHFVNRFGGLVSISEDGEVTSVMWDDHNTPDFFVEAVKMMKQIVLKSRVTGVFISSDRVLGQPHSGGWDHMSVTLPTQKVYRSGVKTARQVMAEKREDFRILIAGLMEYSLNAIDQAVTLLESESLYRSDKVLGVAKFLQELHIKRQNTRNSRAQDNITWLAVATAPDGFCHVKSSMIGTLLDDIINGLSFDYISRRFAEKMNPSNYMRAQVAPSQGNIQQAEKIVEKMGIANSLKRRYAIFEEIPHFLWKSNKSEQKSSKTNGVFSNIIPKDKDAKSNKVSLPNTTMTWDKFQRIVLPTAKSIEVMVDNPNRLMAIVTASDQHAPSILQWDNPFSWYYHGGIDGEIKRRVESAGGRYEGNEIRCSLIWEGYTDLDLHCVTPRGEHIYYGDKMSSCNGWLDIDMNGGSHRDYSPVENIRWSNGHASKGEYVFYVHNYCERGSGKTPFKVELEVNGQIYSYHGVAGNTGFKETIFTFDYVKGQHPDIPSTNYSSDNAWNVQPNSFVKVKGITNSPNLWNEEKVTHSGQHIFFLLDGCRDLSEGKGRGFFNETLKSELREIRKTLEAYTANTPIEDAENASACGVGYSKDSEWDLTLKIISNNSTRIIKIDRWD